MAIRMLQSLSTILALSGCVAAPPPTPAMMVVPGPGKDLAAFQQDDAICRQHAEAHTGYGGPVSPPTLTAAPSNGAGTSPTAPAQPVIGDQTGYLQCMASRGDKVAPTPLSMGSYAYGYPFAYAYGYPFGYPYGYPYGFYDGGFIGFYGGSGFHRGGFVRSGFAHAGFGHGGFDHAGGGHAGGGHGGGGHR